MQQFASPNTEGDLHAQLARISGRILGPSEDWTTWSDEWNPIMEGFAQARGMTPNALHSLPNGKPSDAVRQEVKSKATVLSFPARSGGKVAGRGVSAKEGQSGIDLAGVLVGDAVASPVADRLLGDAQNLGKADLGDPLGVPRKDAGEGSAATFVHSAPLIQDELYKHKRDLCAFGGKSQENAEMADIPRPELFSSFSSWIKAVLERPNVTQKKLAEICHCTQQSVASWKKGSRPKVDPLTRLAQWAGADYQMLRMLVDDKPIPNTPRARSATRLRREPEVEQIAGMLDSIADDEDGLRLARVLVQELVDQRQQLKKRRHG